MRNSYRGGAAALALFLALGAILACSSESAGGDEGAEGSSPVADAASDTGEEGGDEPQSDAEGPEADVVTDGDAADAQQGDDPDAAACAHCPGFLCVDGECVECVGNENCTHPEWCRNYECVQTLCSGGAGRCEGGAPQVCAEDGESWVDAEPCGADQVCVQGKCLGVVCEPGERYCQHLELYVCDSLGTGFAKQPCPPGTACFPGTGTCGAVKPNMLMIFDTSGSMGPSPAMDFFPCICGAGNCPKLSWPDCEDLECPRTRLGVAKKVMLELFETTAFAGVRFAMTRFPQRVSYKQNPSCDAIAGVGHYVPSPGDKITGDAGWHVSPESGYFELNIDEVLCVPFPDSEDFDSKGVATQWVDGTEIFEKFGPECTKNSDCFPDACAIDAGQTTGLCGRHTNPELQANGMTPLGRSLFYAGEYIRKVVVADGKPCEVDADCENVNYYCGPDGTCFDPLRDCRPNIVVLFTDGVENQNEEVTDFFNPRVQAKRLRYGLGCAFDSDCGEGSKCQNAICQGYETPNAGTPEMIYYIDGQGANRLRDRLGKPIRVITHVVDISDGAGGEINNRRVADHGGGIFYSVDSDDPEKLLEAFQSVLDIKENISVCIPSFPSPP